MRISIINTIVIASVLHDVLRLLPSLFLCNASASLAVAAAAAAMTTDEYGDYNGLNLSNGYDLILMGSYTRHYG
jgi:hypothetical protein